MLPTFDKCIYQILEKSRVQAAVKQSVPKNAGRRVRSGIGQRPFYYDVEQQAARQQKKKPLSGLVGKIEALHGASQGSGSISDVVDVIRKPAAAYTVAASREQWVDRVIQRRFKVQHPAPVKRPRLFIARSKHNKADTYYEISRTGQVMEFDANQGKWIQAVDVNIVKRITRAYDFFKNPGQDLYIDELPPKR